MKLEKRPKMSVLVFHCVHTLNDRKYFRANYRNVLKDRDGWCREH